MSIFEEYGYSMDKYEHSKEIYSEDIQKGNANCADPHQTTHNVASDQSRHCLQIVSLLLLFFFFEYLNRLA